MGPERALVPAKGPLGSGTVVPGLKGQRTHLYPASGQAVQTVPVGPEGGGSGRECREKQQQEWWRQRQAHRNRDAKDPQARTEAPGLCATSGPAGWPRPRARPHPAWDHAPSSLSPPKGLQRRCHPLASSGIRDLFWTSGPYFPSPVRVHSSSTKSVNAPALRGQTVPPHSCRGRWRDADGHGSFWARHSTARWRNRPGEFLFMFLNLSG